MQEKNLTKVLRIALGVILLVFGVNKGFNLFPTPTPPAESIVYWVGLTASNYILPTVMIIEILVGIALITNKYTTLALILLLPVTYNIFMYHVMLDTSGILVPLGMLISQVFLIYNYKENYAWLLKA